MKAILIVDDEPDLAEAISCFLEERGYLTTYCENVDSAIQKMTENIYDLVISDIKMPEKDGLYFYNLVKNDLHKKNIPFVFMTGHSEKINMQKAYEMGVDEFVNKPFDLDDMHCVVNLLLKGDSDEQYKNEKFYKINLREFLQSSSNKYDIFLKINDNFLCLVKKGHDLLPERLQNYSKKGIEFIYLTSADFSDYIGMQINISATIKDRPMEKTKKIRLFNHFCKTLSESALNQNLSEDLYKKAYGSFENYTKISFDNNDLYSLIYSLRNFSTDVSARSVLVSFLALVVFQHWKWTSPRQLSRISLAALLCDVGLTQSPDLLEKNYSDMTGDELRRYEKHPLQSYLILSKMKSIPQEILYVAVQHHENDAGLGFPHRISKLKLHPYARVIHALSEFVEKAENLSSKPAIKECLDTLLGFENKLISQQVLKTLYQVFDIPIPLELKKVLLPTDITRFN